ncbi:hypothetical protein FBQ80_17245 [Candidatus Brocadia sp. AMX2]|nr:hypothetical protein [Candidatus Brocadia sp. AMX2]NOG43368.1 hypothetical protein [Planctomycetota bacterium]
MLCYAITPLCVDSYYNYGIYGIDRIGGETLSIPHNLRLKGVDRIEWQATIPHQVFGLLKNYLHYIHQCFPPR